MQQRDLFFVIPTYRLKEVGETVEQYDEHFWRNGHSVRMIVFDDSSPANQQKYYATLEETKTHNELYYVGPKEKEEFIAYLNRRLRDKRLEGLVKNLFRPSLRITFTGYGCSRTASRPRTWMLLRTIYEAPTCAILRPRKSSMKKCRTCSRKRFMLR
jgi:hypothetical protein